MIVFSNSNSKEEKCVEEELVYYCIIINTLKLKMVTYLCLSFFEKRLFDLCMHSFFLHVIDILARRDTMFNQYNFATQEKRQFGIIHICLIIIKIKNQLKKN